MKTLLTMTSLISILLIAPFLIPVNDLEDTVVPRLLADEDSMFVTINNADIHYKAKGEGKPLLMLLHGFGASTFSWREVIGPLSEEFSVIAFDRPGFGLTSRPLGEDISSFNPYSLEGQVELTVSLMEYLGFEEAVLVGHSAGGLTALEVAAQHPEKVLGLVLVDAAIYTEDTDSFLFKILTSTPQGRHLGPLISRTLLRNSDSILEMAWYDPERLTDEIREGYRKPLKASNWDRALWELTLARRPYDSSKVQSVRIPSLVITGDSDRIVPVQDSIRLAEELHSAELFILPETGHLPQEESPALFLEIVIPFVRSLIEKD